MGRNIVHTIYIATKLGEVFELWVDSNEIVALKKRWYVAHTADCSEQEGTVVEKR
jgi:hypothetical protein